MQITYELDDVGAKSLERLAKQNNQSLDECINNILKAQFDGIIEQQEQLNKQEKLETNKDIIDNITAATDEQILQIKAAIDNILN